MSRCKPEKPACEAIALLDHVWGSMRRSSGLSCARANNSMRSALHLAIGAGLSFSVDAFAYITKNYQSRYWLGACTEWWYAAAIAEGNKDAVLSYEAYAQRKPFIADAVEPIRARYAHSAGTRKRERLAVGSRFRWCGEMCEVTSFNDSEGHLLACSYKHTSGHKRKINKRYKITVKDIREARKAMRNGFRAGSYMTGDC